MPVSPAGVVTCCFMMNVKAQMSLVFSHLIRSLEARPFIYRSIRSVFLQFEMGKDNTAELW